MTKNNNDNINNNNNKFNIPDYKHNYKQQKHTKSSNCNSFNSKICNTFRLVIKNT